MPPSTRLAIFRFAFGVKPVDGKIFWILATVFRLKPSRNSIGALRYEQSIFIFAVVSPKRLPFGKFFQLNPFVAFCLTNYADYSSQPFSNR